MKLKRLVLNKEVVARISDDQMSHLLGGSYYTPVDKTYVAPNYYATATVQYSQAGTGCNGETCGSAWTCNG